MKIFVLSFMMLASFGASGQTQTASRSIKTTSKITTESVEPDGSETVETKTSETVETPAPVEAEGGLKRGARHAKKAVENVISNGGDRRDENSFSLMLEYSPLDLILPGKIGGSAGYVESRSIIDEFEYLGTTISAPFFITDIGGMKDQRLSLVRRSFGERNSFNVHYGLSYFNFSVNVGNAYLASASNLPAYVDVMRSKSLGLIFGIGNRWLFPHGLSIGVDWLSWAQPLVVLDQSSEVINYIQDQNAKKTLQDAFQLSMYLPRITVFKFALGFVF